ncbi:MAG: hypothetical protein ACR2Q3_09865 [Woeseiaceae bacterium]
MQIRITIATALALMLTNVSVVAQFRTIELAHEVPLTEFVVPVTQNGTLTFRGCPDCKSFSSRLTPNTLYIVNKQPVSLQEFRKQVTSVGDRSDYSLTVVQHLETNTVSKVSITL